jgi:hypothetical protein
MPRLVGMITHDVNSPDQLTKQDDRELLSKICSLAHFSWLRASPSQILHLQYHPYQRPGIITSTVQYSSRLIQRIAEPWVIDEPDICCNVCCLVDRGRSDNMRHV